VGDAAITMAINIHNSVKNFKILQKINYALDHGNSYADRE
jgi:hypothetical protein